jgi:hypothetical protein
MTERRSCTVTDFHISGEPVRRLPYRWRQPANCGDCGVPRGGYHHPGCCLERCPRCPPGRQAISCDCRYDEDPPDPDDDLWDDDLDEDDLAPSDLSLDGRRAVWRVDGHAVLLDEHGIAPVTDGR